MRAETDIVDGMFRRRCFYALTGASLLLCVGTSILWARSKFGDCLICCGRQHGVICETAHGIMTFLILAPEKPEDILSETVDHNEMYNTGFRYKREDADDAGVYYDCWTPPFPLHKWLGVHFGPLGGDTYFGIVQWEFVTVPIWELVCIEALLPAAITIQFMRRRFSKKSRGLCPSCGYDLRAMPDRCSECGAIPAEKKLTPQ